LDACPDFVLDQADQVLKTAMSTRNLGILHSYLVVLKELPRQHASHLLQRLSECFTEEVLQSLRDEKTFGEMFTILKIIAEADPKLTFEFVNRIPIISKGVAGGLATVYDQISEHGDEESLLLELLDNVARVSKFNQVRISKALKRILTQLDQKLGGRKVVAMVFGAYKDIKDDKALKTFIEAALKVRSWTRQDTMNLLGDSDLPGPVRGLLAAKIK
jgi:hypothetical protein